MGTKETRERQLRRYREIQRNIDVDNIDPPTDVDSLAVTEIEPKKESDFEHLAWLMLNGNAVWIDSTREWWIQRDGIWRRDTSREVVGRITFSIVRKYRPKASGAFIDRIERGARTMLAIDPGVFDQHPWLLGVANGVVDLRTGALSPASASKFITRAAPTRYVYDAECPTWLDHLDQLFDGNQAHIDFYQKAVGSALVGDSNQKPQIFVYLLGPEGSGKGAAGRALTRALGEGEHVASIRAGDLTTRGFERHTQWMMRFKQARLAIVEEVERDQLNVSRLKALSGGDPITANQMRQNDATWRPTHTLFLSSNDPPDFGGDTTGMVRRYMPIKTGPTVQPVEGYEERLASEAEGILAWCIDGCLMWQEDDAGGAIPMSTEMIEMQTEHLLGNDEFAELITNGWLHVEPGWTASRAQIRKAYIDHLTEDTERRPDINPPSKAELTRLYQWVANRPNVRLVDTVRLDDGSRGRGFKGIGIGISLEDSD